jgi:hypothetical protein
MLGKRPRTANQPTSPSRISAGRAARQPSCARARHLQRGPHRLQPSMVTIVASLPRAQPAVVEYSRVVGCIFCSTQGRGADVPCPAAPWGARSDSVGAVPAAIRPCPDRMPPVHQSQHPRTATKGRCPHARRTGDGSQRLGHVRSALRLKRSLRPRTWIRSKPPTR